MSRFPVLRDEGEAVGGDEARLGEGIDEALEVKKPNKSSRQLPVICR